MIDAPPRFIVRHCAPKMILMVSVSLIVPGKAGSSGIIIITCSIQLLRRVHGPINRSYFELLSSLGRTNDTLNDGRGYLVYDRTTSSGA
jgi:hypothetical protein